MTTNNHHLHYRTELSLLKVDALKDQKVPRISSDQFHQYWEIEQDHMFTIADSYIFCEQPTVAGLEEFAHEPHVYDQLEKTGHHKLEAHKRLSMLEGILDDIIRQCSKMHLIPVHDIEAMTLDEFNALLKEKKPAVVPESVAHRKKGYVWRKEQGQWIIETGEAYQKWAQHLLPSQDAQSVSGLVTYAVPAPVTGKAKLHLSFSGTTDIPKGTVLVTGMTNPQLVPMLSNAAAIVTDEGGLMCHAAIISRELKIPCIVGTKDATQIFKDGDTVRVDTQAGTATKLT